MTTHGEKSSVAASDKRVARKAALPKAGVVTVGYAFSGDVADLPKALHEDVGSERIQTVLLPETPRAEDALRGSKRFSRVRLKGFVLERPRPAGTEGVHPHSIGDLDDAEAFEPDARARAILRGRSYAAQDLRASGGSYAIDEVRALLNNVSRQAVDKRVHEGTLLAVPGPGGARRFPTAQFDGHGVPVNGLKAVRKALAFSSPWAVLNFLVNANDHLDGRRPIDALHQGDVDAVVVAAASVGVQGA